MSEGNRLRRVGVLWKPKPGAKSKGTGALTINGLRQRFVVLTNDHKRTDRDPDYVLMSSDEPEVDDFQRPPATPTPAATASQVNDDIPF
jgi:hypothetical protein